MKTKTKKELFNLLLGICLIAGIGYVIYPPIADFVKITAYVMSLEDPPAYQKHVNNFKACGCAKFKNTSVRGTLLSGGTTVYHIVCEDGHEYKSQFCDGCQVMAYDYMLMPLCGTKEAEPANRDKVVEIYTTHAKSEYKNW